MNEANTPTPLVRPKNGKRGSPTKFNRRLANRLKRSVGLGVPRTHAARAAGVSYQSLLTYEKKYPAFADEMEQAASKGIEKRVEKIEEASAAGDWRASAWLLEHCPGSAEHFSRSRIELTGKDGSPLTATVAIYLPQKDNSQSAVEVNAPKQIE